VDFGDPRVFTIDFVAQTLGQEMDLGLWKSPVQRIEHDGQRDHVPQVEGLYDEDPFDLVIQGSFSDENC